MDIQFYNPAVPESAENRSHFFSMKIQEASRPNLDIDVRTVPGMRKQTMSNLLTRTTKGRLTASAKRDLAAFIAERKQNPESHRLPRTSQYALSNRSRHLIHLCNADARKTFAYCKDKNPRKKNILGAKPSLNSQPWREDVIEYRGKFKGYKGSELVPTMKSYGEIDATAKIFGFIVGDKDGSLIASKGYEFRADNFGVKLVRLSSGGEYHPNSSDVLTGINTIRAKLLANEAIRIECAKNAAQPGKQDAVEKANRDARFLSCEKEICVSDSVKAGNCHTGSVAFCSVFGIDALCLPLNVV